MIGEKETARKPTCRNDSIHGNHCKVPEMGRRLSQWITLHDLRNGIRGLECICALTAPLERIYFLAVIWALRALAKETVLKSSILPNANLRNEFKGCILDLQARKR